MSANPLPITKLSVDQIKKVFSWCERSFVDQIGGGFNQQLESVLEYIKVISNNVASYQEKQVYNKMYETLIINKVEMHDAFNSFLKQYFKDKIVPQNNKEFDFDNLSIVSDSQIENDISSKRLEKTISDTLGDDLQHLSKRMEFLLGKNKNPFSPDILASALTSSLQKIFNDINLQKQIVQMFSNSWPESVKNTYQGMNDYLVANDVLVDIRGYRARPTAEPEQPVVSPNVDLSEKLVEISKNNLQNNLNNPPENPYQHGFSGQTEQRLPSDPQDISAMFQKIMSAGSRGAPTGQGYPGQNVDNANGFLGGTSQVPHFNPVSYHTMQGINELHKRVIQQNKATQLNVQDLNSFLNGKANTDPVPFENVIKQLSKTSDNQFDQVIIDLVAVVFDNIFSQEGLPEHIKFLMSKLQLPVLKTALNDKNFFIQKDSPVRLFLNTISKSETIYNTESLVKFEKIIDKILSHEEIDAEIFQTALQQVQALAKDQTTKEDLIIEKSSNILEEDERCHSYVEQIIAFSQKMTQKIGYEPVRVFIENIWAPSFSKKWTASVPKGSVDFIKSLQLEAKVQLNHAVLVFDMIIWSTQIEEKTPENIEKLRTYIPKIRDGLNKICSDLNISSDDASSLGFLLAEKHLYLIQKEEDKKKIHQKNIEENEQKIVQNYKDKNKVQDNVLKAQIEITNTKTNFDDIFVKGQWFDFTKEQIKMKLLWVSPKKTLFLFNNPKDKKVYRFDKGTIWNKFKDQTLKTLEVTELNTDNLIDGAVRELAHKSYH
jgi:Protein of unknown function (DUF1631)